MDSSTFFVSGALPDDEPMEEIKPDSTRMSIFAQESMSFKQTNYDFFITNLTGREIELRQLKDDTKEALKKINATFFNLAGNWFFPFTILVAVVKNLQNYLSMKESFMEDKANRKNPGLSVIVWDIETFLIMLSDDVQERIQKTKNDLLERSQKIIDHPGYKDADKVDKLAALEVTLRIHSQCIRSKPKLKKDGTVSQANGNVKPAIFTDYILAFGLCRYVKEGGIVPVTSLNDTNVTVQLFTRSNDWSQKSVHYGKNGCDDLARTDSTTVGFMIRNLFPFELEFPALKHILKHPKMQKLQQLLQRRNLTLALLKHWPKAPYSRTPQELQAIVENETSESAYEGQPSDERGEKKKVSTAVDREPPSSDDEEIVNGDETEIFQQSQEFNFDFEEEITPPSAKKSRKSQRKK